MGNIIMGAVIVWIIAMIIAWMARNVKQGKSFCGADYGNLVKAQKSDKK